MTTATLSPAPIATASLESVGLDPDRLATLDRLIERHTSENRYPGAQYAVARYGKLVRVATFGDARVDPSAVSADDQTLWLMFSQTKVIVTAALWQLVEAGELRFTGPNSRPHSRVRGQREGRYYALPGHHTPGWISECRSAGGGMGGSRFAKEGCQRLQPGVDSRIQGPLPRHGGPLGCRRPDRSRNRRRLPKSCQGRTAAPHRT